MANRIGSVCALMLALMLALTSVTTTVARTEAGIGHIVSVCSDGEVHLMRLGADGAPLSHDHSCPYCVLLNLMLEAPATAARGVVAVCAVALTVAALPVRAEGGAGNVRVRGPPAVA